MITFKAHASSSAGNLYTVTDGATALLLDAGLPLAEIRRRLNFSTSDLYAALVSHGHADHCSGVPDLMKAGLDCYMSAPAAEAAGISGHRLRVIAPLAAVRIGTWRVLAWPAVHDVDCLGFLLASDGGDRLLYATDTAYIPYAFERLTIVAAECNHSLAILRARVAAGALPAEQRQRLLRTHMALERLTGWLGRIDRSRLQEVHLLHLSDDNSDAEAFRLAIMAAAGTPVYVAPI